MIAALTAIDHHEDARILCDRIIMSCKVLQDMTAFVSLPLIREYAPAGAAYDSLIDSYPDAPAIRQAMSNHLFREWQTDTRIRMTRAVCEEAIRELEKRFAIAGIRGPFGRVQSNPRIALSIAINNL